MAHKDRKVVQVLLGELSNVPQRCEGYRQEMRHLLGDVLNVERDHSISRTNVVKKIAGSVNTLAMFLYKSQGNPNTRKGGGE